MAVLVGLLPKRPRKCFLPAALVAMSALVAVPAEAQQVDHPASGLPIPRSHLTPEDRDRAIRIATGGAVEPGLARSPSRAGRTVVSRVEMTVGDKDDPESLFAVVTMYNYTRHETIRRVIDVARARIVSERVDNDGSAPLAPVETDQARRLVLGDSRIPQLLGASLDNVDLEFLNPLITDTRHPCFGKRVALVLFRKGRGYLTGPPSVCANLTDDEVVLED